MAETVFKKAASKDKMHCQVGASLCKLSLSLSFFLSFFLPLLSLSIYIYWNRTLGVNTKLGRGTESRMWLCRFAGEAVRGQLPSGGDSGEVRTRERRDGDEALPHR